LFLLPSSSFFIAMVMDNFLHVFPHYLPSFFLFWNEWIYFFTLSKLSLSLIQQWIEKIYHFFPPLQPPPLEWMKYSKVFLVFNFNKNLAKRFNMVVKIIDMIKIFILFWYIDGNFDLVAFPRLKDIWQSL
jgi:hypothetical protein